MNEECLEPMHERFWKEWPVIEFWESLLKKELPPNIQVHQIYAKAGVILQILTPNAHILIIPLPTLRGI